MVKKFGKGETFALSLHPLSREMASEDGETGGVERLKKIEKNLKKFGG